MVKLLIKNGPTDAYELFESLLGQQNSQDGLINDPRFQENRFEWPFGWRLDKNLVEREPDGGLSIIYFGRGTPVLIEQVTKVTLGMYRASVTISGEASRTEGFYALNVECWMGAELARLTIDNLFLYDTTFSVDFEVENKACSFIHVQMLGQAGVFPRPIQTYLDSIQVKIVEKTSAP